MTSAESTPEGRDRDRAPDEATGPDAPPVPPANPAYSTPPPEGIAESEDG